MTNEANETGSVTIHINGGLPEDAGRILAERVRDQVDREMLATIGGSNAVRWQNSHYAQLKARIDARIAKRLKIRRTIGNILWWGLLRGPLLVVASAAACVLIWLLASWLANAEDPWDRVKALAGVGVWMAGAYYGWRLRIGTE